jgi:hypothetical protein
MDAQSDMASSATARASVRVDHVTLLVGSLEVSMPYYDALLPLLGFKKKRDHVWTDGSGVFFQFLMAPRQHPNCSDRLGWI